MFFFPLKKIAIHLLSKLLLIIILSFIFLCLNKCMFGQISKHLKAPEFFGGSWKEEHTLHPHSPKSECVKQPWTLSDTTVNTVDVVLVLGEPRVQPVWDASEQVVTENQEKACSGGRAVAKWDLRGPEESGVRAGHWGSPPWGVMS